MKKMTCRELGGACDLEILAETAEEMMSKSAEHAMAINDDAHNKIMEEMKGMKGTEAEGKFMEDFHKNFEAAPEA
ncbi:DUF1059 domain-containing protein [Patescibacteria group bacterium]|nr:DUF1059 domain-containing protein [Patescibacteria group bacterium]